MSKTTMKIDPFDGREATIRRGYLGRKERREASIFSFLNNPLIGAFCIA